MITKTLIAVFLVFSGLRAWTQPGIKDSLYSNIIKEERRLQIQLPDEYKPGSGQKYPVLYLLDGEWNAELFQQVQSWSKQWGFNPPIIMVGVVNSYPKGENQRWRDLTPTVAGPGSGGGPKLLGFLKDELIPYIDKNYPTNGSNILWGHSLGGLFVLYTLFTEPKLFDSYIAADPSAWWDHGYLFRLAREKMGSVTGIKSLFITGRTGAPYHEMGIDSLEAVLKVIAPPSLQWKAVAYADETHVSQQGKSAYDGLKYTIAPLRQDRIHIDPLGGVVVKGMPFTIHCDNLLAEKYIRYSINGEPTVASAKMGAQTVINPVSDVRLKIRTFIVHDSADKVLAASFKLGSPLAAVAKPGQAVQGAWSYAVYHSAGDAATAAAATKSGTTLEQFNPNGLDSTDFFCKLGGYLEAKQKGYYVFELAGEPGNKLIVGDQVLEVAAGKDYNSFIVPLQKGFYVIRFEYSHHKGGRDFDFSYKLPGASGDGGIDPSVMYYVR
jgi:predicted alpha/beta superfamily hydrolase